MSKRTRKAVVWVMVGTMVISVIAGVVVYFI